MLISKHYIKIMSLSPSLQWVMEPKRGCCLWSPFCPPVMHHIDCSMGKRSRYSFSDAENIRPQSVFTTDIVCLDHSHTSTVIWIRPSSLHQISMYHRPIELWNHRPMGWKGLMVIEAGAEITNFWPNILCSLLHGAELLLRSGCPGRQNISQNPFVCRRPCD